MRPLLPLLLSSLLLLAFLPSTAGWATPPMERAIKAGETSAVLALLDQGADLDAQSGKAQLTPLKLAVTYHKADIVKALLDRGADVNIRQRGTSALSLASLAGDLEIVTLLLSKGAEVTDRDILWAQGPQRAAIVEMLKKALSAQPPSTPDAAPVPAAPPEASKPAIPSSEVSPSYKMGERPDDYALLIGIGTYMDAPESKFSENDVSLMREHLLALGWPSRNIITLTGKMAGRAGISKYLERWLPNNMIENSRIFFYFSGHGATDPNTRQAYLLPWDGDAGLLEATGYPLSRLYQKLNALDSKEALVVLDAGFTARAPVEKPNMATGDMGDIIALTAASDNETAGVLEGKRHGALTYYFLKGLNEEAQGPEKSVTIKKLFHYVRSQVQEAARAEGRTQTPRLATGALGESDLRLR